MTSTTPALTPEQLRKETRSAWLEARKDPARRDVAGYLAVAYDQLERACKAAANGTAWSGIGADQ